MEAVVKEESTIALRFIVCFWATGEEHCRASKQDQAVATRIRRRETRLGRSWGEVA